jgi:hypothetical protein
VGGLLGVLGIIGEFLNAANMSRTDREGGYVNIGGCILVTDPTKLPEGTRLRDDSTGLHYTIKKGGFVVADPGDI